jgi:hypothetical protein
MEFHKDTIDKGIVNAGVGATTIKTTRYFD